MDELVDEPVGAGEPANNRRILKVRLRQDHVIRLHEMRILQGRSIASLLEKILDDYFDKDAANGNGSRTVPGQRH